MSKINVDTWEPESGTAATLMATGDTVTLPSGAILAVASGGDINVASGGDINVASGGNINVASSGEIDIASGATLDVNGTIDLTGATKTGFPAGGNTQASQWRLDTNLTVAGSWAVIGANWEQPHADDMPGTIGSAMAVDASTGAWTFPATGVWYVAWRLVSLANVGNNYFTAAIYVTDDDGSGWEYAANQRMLNSTNWWDPCFVDYIVQISDVSNDKVKLSAVCESNTCTVQTDTDSNECAVTFIKLGD